MTDTKKCKHCGRQIHSQAQYCMYCMVSQNEKADITPTDLRKKRMGLRIPLLIAVGCVVTFGFVFGIWQLLKPTMLDSPNTPGALISGSETTTTANEYLPDDQPIVENVNPDPDHLGSIQGTEPLFTNPQITTAPHSEPNSGDNKPVQDPEPETDLPTQNSEMQIPDTPEEDPTEPDVTTPVCNHYFIAASCTTPMTCIYCNATLGTADLNAHDWVAQTATVRHNEKGHYEDVTTSVKKTKYLCFFCGYTQAGFDSLDEVYEHMPVHSNKSTYDWVMSHPTYRTETKEVWVDVTEQRWIVDQKAYDETVITGYTCSICNKTKEA